MGEIMSNKIFPLPQVLRQMRDGPVQIEARAMKPIERQPDAEDDFLQLERARLAYEESAAQTEVLRLEYERAKAKIRALMKERAPDV